MNNNAAVATNIRRKKQSGFQKLWRKAERLKKQNTLFKNKFEALVQRVETTLRPAEKDAASADKPLLHRLLTLGQRKSLAQWQRVELDIWIEELVHEMLAFGLVDQELRDDMARYDAFRMGISLEDDEIAPPSEQLIEIIEREDAAYVAATEAARKAAAVHKVEQVLDQVLGPEPGPPLNQQQVVADLFEEEFDRELEQRRIEYRQTREAMKQELLDVMLGDVESQFAPGSSDAETEEPFGYDFDGEEVGDFEHTMEPANDAVVSNEVFQRLFRITAAKLHPDRELDTEKRQVKQKLMADLLEARKNGDVMTVIELHQQYVDGTGGLTTSDEKQLLGALNRQIEELQYEKERIISQSPIHEMIYERFYNASRKKVDRMIEAHLEQIKQDKRDIEAMRDQIKSLKTLKPWLEQRRAASNPFSDLSWMNE